MDSYSYSPTTTDNCLTFERVRLWNFEQVTDWLQENNFKEYQQLFTENDITGDVLLELNHQVLKEMNIKFIGDRIRILVAVKNLLKTCSINNPSPYSSYSTYYYNININNINNIISNNVGNNNIIIKSKDQNSPLSRSSSKSKSKSKSNSNLNSNSNSNNINIINIVNSNPNSRSSNSVNGNNNNNDYSSKTLKIGTPSPSRQSIESSIMSIESVKSRCIKVIGQDQTCTIPINDISDAKSILTRVLQKFNINEDVERYSLFTTSETGSARCLTDEELVQICKSSDRPERERLILRKKHIQMSHEEIQKQLRYKKLANFFGEKPPTTPQAPQVGISHKKLRNFFGQRPPSELISLNLTEFFPGHDSEELERSARNSIRRASRLSAASRYSKTKSRRISTLYDEDDGINDNHSINRSNSLLSATTNDYSPESTIAEEEEEEEVLEYEDEYEEEYEEDEDWTPDQDDESGNSVFKWIKGSLIGMGSFGSVYLGLNAITGALMAVKQVELPTGQSSNEERKKSMLDALQREITLLKELHHDHIVQYLGSQHDEKTLNIFLEYVPGGSVSTMINNYGPLEETLVRSFVRQILSGLSYLHDKEIIHRDIKGANILVDEKGGIKISDFGISKKVEDQFMAATSSHRPSLQGSVFWMAPEVVKQTAYTSKADIWSLGCLIVEMFTGDHPFPEFNQMQAMFKIGSQSCSPELPDGISNEAREFLKKTFELNHDDRPAAKILLTHPFALSTSVKSGTTSSP
ncbi:hypothetical protein Glove_718g60 [Diversispora epigaea]|uniref:mitogen-activated protein kinase kinase kinase n=1 Tax=Diversispora epigaea TaxID=1348612 RepID=A0A397G414_9GLOM|nr:hypothetical protein Glove_718g60 [Diversispora epigaea]